MTKATIGYLSNKVNGISIKSTYKAHVSNYTNYKERNIRKIIIHYTGNKKDTATANAKYFANNRSLGASAHFFVDEKNIFQSVELRDVAHHAGNWLVNCESIGIVLKGQLSIVSYSYHGNEMIYSMINKNELFVPDIKSLIKLRCDEVNKLLEHFGIAFDWEE